MFHHESLPVWSHDGISARDVIEIVHNLLLKFEEFYIGVINWSYYWKSLEIRFTITKLYLPWNEIPGHKGIVIKDKTAGKFNLVYKSRCSFQVLIGTPNDAKFGYTIRVMWSHIVCRSSSINIKGTLRYTVAPDTLF